MKKVLALLLALMFVFSCTACGGDNDTKDPADDQTASGEWEKVNFMFAHDEGVDSEVDNYAHIFADLVSEATGGAVTFDIYVDGQLASTTALAEMIQNGAVECGAFGCGSSGVLVEESNIFSLHFLMPSNIDDYQKLLNECSAIDTMNELFYDANLKVLDTVTEGYYYWTANKALDTPDAFKGVKFRTMDSPLISSSYNAYGANATPIAFSELYTALQLKTVDGQTNPPLTIRDTKIYEVQSHITDGRSDSYVFFLMFNKNVWEGLDSKMQDMLMDCAAKANVKYHEKMDPIREEVLQSLINDHVMTYVEVSDEAREQFRELSYPVWEQYVNTVGGKSQELLDAIKEYQGIK